MTKRGVKLTDNLINLLSMWEATMPPAQAAKEQARVGRAFQQGEAVVRRLLPGPWRAVYVHQRLEEEKVRDPGPNEDGMRMSCKAGCSACCHSYVAVTTEEAELLAELVRTGKATVDMDRLERQAELAQGGNDDTWWRDVPWGMSGCVFLGERGECTVYGSRPGACRLLTSYDPASKCDKRTSPLGTKIVRWTYAEAEALYSAYLNAVDTGHLPALLLAALRRKR